MWWHIQPRKQGKRKGGGGWKKFEKERGDGGQAMHGVLGTLCQLWELYMSGKASLTYWKVKYGETATLMDFF